MAEWENCPDISEQKHSYGEDEEASRIIKQINFG